MHNYIGERFSKIIDFVGGIKYLVEIKTVHKEENIV